MLDSTLVMVSSEFGRTPKINATAGRDHWPKVFSVVLAGGGIKKGFVYGSSDATATEPENDPLTVEDLAMTVYHQLGIDGEKKLLAPGNRPIDIVREGQRPQGTDRVDEPFMAKRRSVSHAVCQGTRRADARASSPGLIEISMIKHVLCGAGCSGSSAHGERCLAGAWTTSCRAADSAAPKRSCFSTALGWPTPRKSSSTTPASA